jgi:hypothetical protein
MLLVPSAASAAEPATSTAEPGAEKPKTEDSTAGLKGFELMLRPSFGGAPSDSPVKIIPNGRVQGDFGTLLSGASTPWSSGFVGQAAIGYRFLPLLSAGLRGGFRSSSASNLPDGSTDLSRSGWDAGFYARVYPLALTPSIAKYLDPWVGVGVGYQRDSQSFKKNVAVTDGKNVGSVNADIAIDHHAISIPLSIGVDYRVLSFLSVGPSFEVAVNAPVAGCVATSAAGTSGSSYCTNSDPGKSFLKADTYLAWNAGLDVKVTF